SAEDLALPIGPSIFPEDGKIACSDRGADQGGCYLITGGAKASFTSAEVFSGLGFSFSRAITADLSQVPAALNINNVTDPHRQGVLINNNGTVELVSPGGFWGIPDLATFNSWGFSFADVLPANVADLALVQNGVL